MNHEKEFFPENYKHSIYKNDILKDGSDVAVFVTGSILEEAVKVCDMLDREGISVKLINVTTIKPFNTEEVVNVARDISRIVVIEEHNIHGGLAGIIAETLMYAGISAKILPIGLKDNFAEGYGSQQMVRKVNGLDAESIYHQIMESNLI